MPFCLIPTKVKEFQKALKGKDIKIEELLNMTSEERTALLEKYAGSSAKEVNLLFEEKLVLKNRMLGIKNWASKVGEIGRYDPAKKAKIEELISEYRAKQQERIFSPKENEAFLSDLAEETLGTRITREEAKSVFDLTSKMEELKKGFDGKWTSEKERLDYGASKVILENYVSNLKSNLSIWEALKARGYEFKATFKENAPKAIGDLLLDIAKTITENSISLVATLDNSFIGRQGLKTLMTHPTIWWNGAKNSFVDIAKTLGGKKMKDALMADIYSRPNYINGNYDLAKLIPKTEEQYPTTLPERVPVVGRILKASETAFTGSAIRMRTGLYDLISGIAEKQGVKMDKVQIQDLGRMVNSLTARAQLGRIGESPIVKLVLWAPRMLKANWDVLTVHTGGYGLETAFIRKQAAMNLAKIVGTTAMILMIAKSIKSDSVETDSRSSNFGKIKVGDTRFDITGGAASLVVLASRLLTNSTKTSGGVISQFGSGIGQTSRWDTFLNFLEGKTTPPTGMVIDWMKGENFQGEKPTLGTSLYSTFTPIILQNAISLKDDNSVAAVLGVILDGLGINANTYKASQTNWNLNPGKELQAFQKKVGEAKFKEANDVFNKEVSQWLNGLGPNLKFQKLSEEDKSKVITNKKSEIKDKIFKKYGFIYKQEKSKPLPKF